MVYIHKNLLIQLNIELATCKNYKNKCFKLEKYISAKLMLSVMMNGKLLVGARQRKFYVGQCPIPGAVLRTQESGKKWLHNLNFVINYIIRKILSN